MFRRHPTFAFYFVLLLLIGGGAVIFVRTFDLDHYRIELQESLGDALNRPVSLGGAQLSFSGGPALDFTRIDIGSAPGQPGRLTASRLLLKPDLTEALRGRLTFREIVLHEPQLTLTPTTAETSAATEESRLASVGAVLDKLLIHTLTIHNGALLRAAPDQPRAAPELVLTGVEARLRGLSLSRAMELELSGNHWQGRQMATFGARGTLSPAGDLRRWRDCQVELAYTLEHLTPQPHLARFLPTNWPLTTSGQLALNGELKGALSSGLRANLELRGEELALRLPELWEQPVPLRRLHLSGVATHADDTWTFSDCDLQADDLKLTGSLILPSKGAESRLTATLTTPPLPLRRLLSCRPLLAAWPEAQRLTGGTLRVVAAEFDGPLSRPSQAQPLLSALKARLELREVGIRLDQPGTLEKLSADLDWNGEQLTVTAGTALMGQRPLSFTGFLEKPWEEAFPLRLEAETFVPAAELLARFSPQPTPGLTLVGPTPLRLRVEGSSKRLQVNLSADLTQVGGAYRGQVEKPPGHPASLNLQGEITPEKWRLTEGQLHMPPLDLHLSGELGRQGRRPFNLKIEVAALDLEQCRAYASLLEKLQARGQVDLRYTLAGRDGRLEKHEGVATLYRVGVHLTKVIADLNDANGQILLAPDHAESRDLTLKLGGSPLDVEAKVAGFSDPTVDVRVRGDSVRADDIIFPNNRSFLRRLDGHLVIDRKGILFDPVKVQLDGGTDATVRGSVSNFSAPEVNLDIEAGYGNIDEVIALWHRPADAPPPPEHKEKNRTRLFIAATAHQGQLGNLRFQEAHGDITLRNGVLTILPLRFNVGAGSCLGQVAVDSSAGSPPLLKISGQLENFDAAAIHRDLLRRKGLLTGVMQGDFSLEGRAGKTFLETSRGGLSFEVRDGVLRKFQFLAKVFSIFNVSQILTLQLPDMDTEGMPFSRLRSTAVLNQGVLSTEDMFIDSTSMNLSLVGDFNLKQETLDLVLGVKPLRIVDQVVTNIPLAGWLLAGEEKALITAHFEITGKSTDPKVSVIPVTSLSEKVLGIFKRVFGLPGKVVSDVGDLFK